jgi:rod shape-determining protein MreC
MKNVPRTLDVRVGDRILTSNYSALFPANIVIGTVQQADDEANTLFRRIVVAPAANFSTLEQVFVVDAKPNPERVALERRIEERVPGRVAP